VSSLSSRRTFLGGAAAGGAALVLLGRPPGTTAAGLARATPIRGATFDQGVASGEPGQRAITLWTRLAGVDRRRPVRYEVATDPGFARVVARGNAFVEPNLAASARVRVTRGLQPGQRYFYRFETADRHSPVGRFVTARPYSHEPVRIAFFSCQELIAGYYHAHADIARKAERGEIDLVVCLGDYVYEQAFAGTGSTIQPPRLQEDRSSPTGEVEYLSEYRRKYAAYHGDADLRAMRASAALVSIWDDHEVEDNYADGIPGGAAQQRRIPFAQRKANGYRAWFEHLPRIAGTRRTYGSIPLGAAELFLLDTRRFRGDQPCNPDDGPFSQPCPPSTTDDPSRPLLGAEQERWLKDGLARSRARWKVVANQVMISSLDAPPGNPLNTDSWDGYGADRRELIRHLTERGIRGVTFVTGDIHTFFAGNVTEIGRLVRGAETAAPRATEFVGSSVTSPGIVDRFARTVAEREALAAVADAFVRGNNPHLVYSNQAYKGYGILEASGGDLRVTYRAVRDARDRNDREVFDLRRFRVRHDDPRVIDEGGPVPLPAPAPPGTPPPPGFPLPPGVPTP